MAVDVLLKSELLHTLRGIHAAGGESAPIDEIDTIINEQGAQGIPLTVCVAIYRLGFNRALQSVALAHGLSIQAEPPD